MDIWLPLLSAIAAAIGGFIGTWVKLKSERNKNLFNHKISVYLKLIESYHYAIINKSDERSRQKYVMAQEQLELVADNEVINISKEFYTQSPANHRDIRASLLRAMRKDLDG